MKLWYRFNRETGENDTFVVDWSGNNNNGTLYGVNRGINNGTEGFVSTGKMGDGIRFNGDHVGIGYVLIPNSASLENLTDNGNSFTFEAWARPEGNGSYQTGGYFVDRPGYHEGLKYTASSQKFYFDVFNSTGSEKGCSASMTSPMNNWYHVAGMWDADIKQIRLYVNGAFACSLTTNQPIREYGTSGYYVGIGTTGGTYNFSFNGTVDDVKMWSRAISAEEINASYNAGTYRLYHNFTNTPDGTYNYTAYVQDLAGNVNQTELRYVRLDSTNIMTFVTPSDANNSWISRNWTYINITANEDNTSTTLVDNSLILGMHLESKNSTNFTSDYSNYANNGNVSDIDSPPVFESGKFGNGLTFDGTDDYIELNKALIGSATKNYTVHLSFNAKTLSGASGKGLISENYDPSNKRWALAANSSGYIDFVWFDSVGTGYNLWTTSSVFTVGQWTQLDLTVTSGTTVNMYVNGAPVTLTSNTITALNSGGTVTMRIGRTRTDFWNGSLDEIEIYNRTLSQEEISRKYNASIGLTRQFEKNVTDLPGDTYSYSIESIDTIGIINNSGNRSIYMDAIFPTIDFVYPTDGTGRTYARNNAYINVSTSDSNNVTAFVDFNSSLIGWYRFNHESGENDTKAIDWSTYGNNVTIQNTNKGMNNGTSGWTQNGKFGGGFNCDGINDEAYVPGSYLGTGTNVTYEFWYNARGYYGENGGSASLLMSKYNWAGQIRGYWLYFYSNKFGGPIGNGTGHGDAYVWTSMPLNTWTHIVFEIYNNPNANFSLYKNGAYIGSNSSTWPYLNSLSDSFRMCNGGIDTREFNGTIDEIKVWNRLLSSDEVNASYNAGLYRLEHNFTGLQEGTYNYTAYSQDLAGNVNQTETRSLTLDTYPFDVDTCRILNETNGYYTLINDVSADSTCFTIGANNVTLDGQGHTITYGSVSTGYAVTGFGYNSTTIKNLNISQTVQAVGNKDAIYFTDANNVLVENNTIFVAYDSPDVSEVFHFERVNASNITNNLINMGDWVIFFYGTNDTNMRYINNSVPTAHYYGFMLYGEANSYFLNNSVPSVDRSAVELYEGSDNNIFVNNTFTANDNVIDIRNSND
ncbi:MAG: LamG-like jellyroll fold domain-containing protein, partial [Candidatus Paceibacterota bacterium]